MCLITTTSALTGMGLPQQWIIPNLSCANNILNHYLYISSSPLLFLFPSINLTANYLESD